MVRIKETDIKQFLAQAQSAAGFAAMKNQFINVPGIGGMAMQVAVS